MALSTCFDPLALPFVRAQTYVDANPPEVLSDEFYNPVQDALARLFGGIAGYSTSISSEEFTQPVQSHVTGSGDAFGDELVVVNTPAGSFKIISVTTPAVGMFGVYHVDGVADGARGAGTDGFGAADAERNVGTMRWLFRARVRCSKYSVIKTSPPGLVFGLGPISAAQPLPVWLSDGTGFWRTFWDAGSTTTAIPTVDNEWVTLWIGCKDADGVVRWYLQRDADPLPLLLDTQTLGTAAIGLAKRYLRYLVTAGALAADNIEIDSIGMICER